MSRINTILKMLEDIANFFKNKSHISEELCGTNNTMCAQSMFIQMSSKISLLSPKSDSG